MSELTKEELEYLFLKLGNRCIFYHDRGLGVVVDDKTANIEAAQKEGFIGVHFTDAEKLKVALETYKLFTD